MTFQLVIFDFDGTLADSAAWVTSVFNPLARRHGFRELSDAEITALRGRSSRDIVRLMGVPPWRLPAIGADFRRLMAEAEGIRLFDGVLPMLQALKTAGLSLAVVSSNSEANVRRILGAEATALVDAFECGAGLFGKPAKFRTVMKRRRVPPARTLCIGDETRDMEAAKAVGAASGAVAWGYATPEILAEFSPAFAFSHPQEVVRALCATAGRSAPVPNR